MRVKVVNFVAFQAGWFACVLGAAAGRPWLGPLAAAGVIALHLALHRPRAAGELILVAMAGSIGYVLDSALVLGGVLVFPAESAFGGPSALWMVALWCMFATTLNASMSWLRGRYLLAAGLGLVAGPAAYFAGARLGAVEIGRGAGASAAAIAGVWAVATPLLLKLSTMVRRLDDPSPREVRA